MEIKTFLKISLIEISFQKINCISLSEYKTKINYRKHVREVNGTDHISMLL